MSDFWLKCDACNQDLPVQVNCGMSLAVRFKPSLVKLDLEKSSATQTLHRCRSCGWVNVFVPSSQLTSNWRADIVTK